MNNWDYAVRSFCDKVFSGRYIILILSISTYCFLMGKCLDLVGQKIMTVETFLGLFAGLTGIVSTIVTFYFMRTDRRTENIEQQEQTK
jgi:hypothetical protein